MKPSTSRSHWRRLRVVFSLRGLMAIVLILGGWLGWVVYRARTQRLAVAAIERAGGRVVYDWGWFGVGQPFEGNPPRLPRFVVDRTGVDFFGTVVEVELIDGHDDEPDENLMLQVGRLSSLGALNLRGCRAVTDADLDHLRGLVRLKEIDLSYTGVRGAGLIRLCGLVQLEALVLEGLPIADVDLAHLAALSSLRTLHVSAENLTDAGLAHLAGLTELRSLGLTGGPITSAGLVHLREMRHLRNLYLDHTKVESLAPLAHLTDIDELWVEGTRIDDPGLIPILGFHSLRVLIVGETRVGDPGLALVANLTSMVHLSLNHTRITDSGLVHLARLFDIRELNLVRTSITDVGLARLPSFKRCNIHIRSTEVTPAGIASMKLSHPNVTLFP